MPEINFNASPEDFIIIHRIASRAAKLPCLRGLAMLTVHMDLVACHCNGTPLDLYKLDTADDQTFAHDIAGIHSHIDRRTGKIGGCFSPRCAKREIPSTVGA